MVAGEAGIGKSSIWRAGCDVAVRGGSRVLTCSPTESETGFSYAGLADLFGDVAAAQLPLLPQPQRRALGSVLLLDDADTERVDQRVVGTALLNLLRALAGEGRVVVAVDDVQWLDLIRPEIPDKRLVV